MNSPRLLPVLACLALTAGCASAPQAPEPPPDVPAAPDAPALEPPEEALRELGDRAAAEALVVEGRQRRERGEHAAALEAFAAACEADPDYGIAHLEWAVTAQYVGLPDDDVRARFVRVLALLPDNPRAHFEGAVFEEAHGDRAAAIAGYRRTVALRGDHFEAHLRLGAALLAEGDVEGAFDAYEQALLLNGGSVAARLGLAEAAERKGDLARAEAALEAIVARFPDVPSHRQRLIAFYERTKQTKKARKARVALERLAPKDERKLRDLKPSRKRRGRR